MSVSHWCAREPVLHIGRNLKANVTEFTMYVQFGSLAQNDGQNFGQAKKTHALF
jgi:hypothetical protein